MSGGAGWVYIYGLGRWAREDEGMKWWEQAPGWAGLGRDEGHGHGHGLSQLLAFGLRTGTGTGKGTVNKLAWRFFLLPAHFQGKGKGREWREGRSRIFRAGVWIRGGWMYRYIATMISGWLGGWEVGGLGACAYHTFTSHHVDLHTHVRGDSLACLNEGNRNFRWSVCCIAPCWRGLKTRQVLGKGARVSGCSHT